MGRTHRTRLSQGLPEARALRRQNDHGGSRPAPCSVFRRPSRGLLCENLFRDAPAGVAAAASAVPVGALNERQTFFRKYSEVMGSPFVFESDGMYVLLLMFPYPIVKRS